MSQHVITMYYCMLKDLELLNSNCTALEGFASFVSRQNKHAGDENDKLFNKLPDKFFSDDIELLKNTSINGEVKKHSGLSFYQKGAYHPTLQNST